MAFAAVFLLGRFAVLPLLTIRHVVLQGDSPLSREETLRVAFGTAFIGAAPLAYGILLVLFMLFLPRGIVGWFERRR